MQKKLISVVLAVLLTLQMLPVVAMADTTPPGLTSGAGAEEGKNDFADGSVSLSDGTETEPAKDNNVYRIGTAEELAWFRTYVNETTEGCDADAVLTTNIDLEDRLWTPISTRTAVAEQYRGTFDGQLHTISGLSVKGTTTNQGLFGSINGATIKNLMVEGSVESSNNYIGGIAGTTRGATIENCSFSGTVTYSGTGSSGNVGGIVGGNQSNPSTISNCVNMADVTGYTAGGILGYSTQANRIENCYNTGTIIGSFRAGGIVGQATTGEIVNCYNIGEIAGASTTPGGIYSFSNATITNCYHLYPSNETPSGTPKGKSTKIESPEGLLALLDSAAFADDIGGINNGYPPLAWQAPPDVNADPSIGLRGDSTIYAGESAGVNETTLSIDLKNITTDDIDSVEWKVETVKGNSAPEDIVGWQTVENDLTKLIVTAKGGGVVTVTATVAAFGETLTAMRDVSVIPKITTAEIKNVKDPGAVALGQTVAVSVFVLGGEEYDYENYPPLTYEWRYNNTSSSANIPGATGRSFSIPTSGYEEGKKLYVEIKCGGAVVKESSDVSEKLRSEDYGILYPVAYDPEFSLPDKVKDNNPLVLPATHMAGGVTANITWSSSDNATINAVSGAVVRPARGTKNVTLTGKCEYGTAFANRTFEITVYSDESAGSEDNRSYLEEAVKALGEWYGPMTPVYGSDTNVGAVLMTDLTAKGYGDVAVTVKSATEVYGGAAIDQSGDLTYFYADPNRSLGQWFGQYRVTFTLTKGADHLDVEDLIVNLHWDGSKVKNVMNSEILSGVTEAVVLGGNDNKDNVTSNLILPRVIDGKKWTRIEWRSSDMSAVSVSAENQGTADTLFSPYVGKVIRGEEDKDVTLTAKFTFGRTSFNEPEIVLYKVFTVKVKALADAETDAIRAGLLQKLKAGFDAVGLTDYVTGQRLPEVDGVYSAANDIQLPTTRDFGVDGKYFPITISGSDNSTLVAPEVANAARVMTYRPLVGAPAKTVTLTVSITDTARGVSASKEFTVRVEPLTRSELDDALNLMDRVKTGYFDGLNNGSYADEFSITGNLHPFQEAAWNEAKNGITWIYDSRKSTGGGIVADELDNWAEQEAWRAFRSSDMSILDHETLNYAQPNQDTFVRINSVLTHDVFGKYWTMYGGEPGYEAFEQLYKQAAPVYVMVEGKNHQTRTQEELGRMRDEAIAKISAPISTGFALFGTRPQTGSRAVAAAASDEALIQTTVSGLEAGSTVFELFRKVLAQEKYTYSAVGSYIKSVTDADGYELSERDSGPNSGWIYTVNGKMPSIYMNGYSLKEGDEVVVRFTNDYTKEDGMNDAEDPNKPSGGASNGGGGGVANTDSSPLNTGAASAAVGSAVKNAAIASNGVLIVNFRNVSEVSQAALDAMVKAAKGKPMEVQFDSMNGSSVEVRLYINPAVLAGNVNVAATTTGAAAKSTKAFFGNFFSNNVAVISFQQQGSFNAAIKVAAKVDLTGMNTKNLVFYSYDKIGNSYRLIPAANYWIDANGYVRFTTKLAGDIVISDGPLAAKTKAP